MKTKIPSRQLLYQHRHRQLGLCAKCSEPVYHPRAALCLRHTLSQRERYHARHPNAKRNTCCLSYRAQARKHP